jgi:hypothetical protein
LYFTLPGICCFKLCVCLGSLLARSGSLCVCGLQAPGSLLKRRVGSGCLRLRRLLHCDNITLGFFQLLLQPRHFPLQLLLLSCWLGTGSLGGRRRLELLTALVPLLLQQALQVCVFGL